MGPFSLQSPTNESSIRGEEKDNSHQDQVTNAIHKPDVIIKVDTIFLKFSKEFITCAIQILLTMAWSQLSDR